MSAVPATRVARALEEIIDAAAGVLAAQSLQATLKAMAEALHPIVQFTSLAVYEADLETRKLNPVFAVGRHVSETLAFSPPLDASITGKAFMRGRLVHLGTSAGLEATVPSAQMAPTAYPRSYPTVGA